MHFTCVVHSIAHKYLSTILTYTSFIYSLVYYVSIESNLHFASLLPYQFYLIATVIVHGGINGTSTRKALGIRNAEISIFTQIFSNTLLERSKEGNIMTFQKSNFLPQNLANCKRSNQYNRKADE